MVYVYIRQGFKLRTRYSAWWKTATVTMKDNKNEGRQFNKVSGVVAGALYQTVPLLSLLPKMHTLLTVCVQCEEVLVKHLKASRQTEWDGDGTSHSGGLVVKHVVATHNANNSRSNGRYQPCCPGAVEKLFIYFLFFCVCQSKSYGHSK